MSGAIETGSGKVESPPAGLGLSVCRRPSSEGPVVDEPRVASF